MTRRLPLLVVLVALLLPGAASAAYQRVSGNPAERLVGMPMDPYAYDYAKACRRSPTKGIKALRAWLERNAGGSYWGFMRCERLSSRSYSLHSEGRALDWHMNVHNRRDRREAKRLIGLLLAPDSAGNEHALARRMGIQEIIWDCKSWWAGPGDMRPYSVCYDRAGKPRRVDDTSAHRNHIHFGLNWAGAKKKTTFWTSGIAR